MTNILIYSAYPLYREGLVTTLSNQKHPFNYLDTGSFRSAIAILNDKEATELMLLDLNDFESLIDYAQLRYIRNSFPHLKILVMSRTNEDSTIATCSSLGATSFMSKRCNAKQVLEFVNNAINNNTWATTVKLNIDKNIISVDEDNRTKFRTLSVKQHNILDCLVSGYSNKEICTLLVMKESTVKSHVSSILKKLEVRTRSKVAALAISNNRYLRKTH